MKVLHFKISRFQLLLFAALLAGCSPEARKAKLLQRAARDFDAGHFDSARIDYLALLQLDSENRTALERLGTISFEQGSPIQALPFLLKTKDLEPTNLKARTRLATAFLSVGKVREAREEALAVIEHSSSFDEAALVLVEASRTQQQIDDATRKIAQTGRPDSACFRMALAGLAMRKGDLLSAENLLRQAVALDPKLSAPHLTRAKLFLLRRDFARADQEFKLAADLAPLRSSARIEYAEFKATTQDLPSAIKLLKEVTLQTPDYLPAWGRLAQIALGQKQYEQALAYLENIFSRDPSSFEGRLLQAQVYLAKEDAKNALNILERLNRAYRNAPSLKYELGRAYFQDNNLPQAITALNQEIALNPDHAEAALLLSEIRLRTGDAEPVVPMLERLLKRDPHLLPAEFLLAVAYRSLGRLDDAAAILHEQLQVSPENAKSQYLLGLILRQQRDMTGAREAFEKTWKLAPDSFSALAQIVDLDVLKGDFASAHRELGLQLQKKPQSAELRLLEARVYAAEGDWNQAKTALRKTLEIDPNNFDAYDLLISAYIASGNLDMALEQLNLFLTKDPASARALMLSGRIYDKLNEFTKARGAYEKLLSAHPDEAQALNNLAYLYAEQFDQLDKARELAWKARALQPDDPAIADTLGWILVESGDCRQGLELLQQSAAKIQNSPEILFHIATAHYMMGELDLARAALRQSAAVKADFSKKKQVEEMLALLGDDSGRMPLPALGELEAMVKRRPNDVVAWLRLAESAAKENNYRRAAAAYESALRISPQLIAAITPLARLYGGPLSDRQKALEYAKQARALAPDDPGVASLLGELLYAAGDYAWAYTLLQESSRHLTGDARAFRSVAWAAYSVGKVEQARQAMESAIKAAPPDEQSENDRAFLALTTLGDKDLAAAEPQIEKILASDSGYVPALMVRARIQTHRLDMKGAAASYRQVLNKFPDFAPAQRDLASIYLEDKEHRADAYRLAIKARKALPDDPELARIFAELFPKREVRTPAAAPDS